MNQSDLGQVIGVSGQQIQKYENGKNSVAGGRLALIAQALSMSVQDFYDYSYSDTKHHDDGNNRLRLETAKHLRGIKNPRHLEVICQLAKVLAA